MLLRTEDLTKAYDSRIHAGQKVLAANKVNITLSAGESIGLFGDSGSGKSTLGQMLAGLLKPTSGKIYFEEKPISYPFKGDVRRQIQILFQHPEISFNPALPIIKSLTEPYAIYHLPYSEEILVENIEKYGLHREHLFRKPAELSGGELQRAALSRILTIKPKLIVLDEPTSMLDVITQAQMIGMLKEYQKETNAAFVFITHNECLCKNFCDRVYAVNDGDVTPL